MIVSNLNTYLKRQFMTSQLVINSDKIVYQCLGHHNGKGINTCECKMWGLYATIRVCFSIYHLHAQKLSDQQRRASLATTRLKKFCSVFLPLTTVFCVCCSIYV